MSKQVGWKVHVDTVFFDRDMTSEDVRLSLIHHDGYVYDIKVRKEIHPASKTFARYRK